MFAIPSEGIMFCISGQGSTISTDIFPPLTLEDGNWEIGLVDFMTYNNIPNVEEGRNNLIYFGEEGKKIAIPAGAYEMEDLHLVIKHRMMEATCNKIYLEPPDEKERYSDMNSTTTTWDIYPSKHGHHEASARMDKPQGPGLPTETHPSKYNPNHVICKPPDFKLKTDTTSMKSWLYCSEKIDFTLPGTIRDLLGFNPRVLEPYKWHPSDRPININAVNVVRITCNVVRGSYTDGREDHVLHEFFPRVDRGFKIIEIPRNVIYLPVSTKRIHNITVSLIDQEGRPVNFQQETISLRLHLKRRD